MHSFAPGRGKTVALTFDDGPGPSTRPILAVLRAAGIRATFFNVGGQLVSHAWVLRREVADGDVIGNHTWSHPDMAQLDLSAQAQQISTTTRFEQKLTSLQPCVFRPPYGSYDRLTLRAAAAQGLSTWTWSVDTDDWRAEGSAGPVWVSRIVRNAKAGLAQRHPVVLMHNALGGDPATVAALPEIIRCFRRHGYRFVGLPAARAVAPGPPAAAA